MGRKTLTVKVEKEDLMNFVEHLETKLKGANYCYEYRGRRLYLTFHGSDECADELEKVARTAHKNFMAMRRPIAGKHRYPKEWLMERNRGVSLSLLGMALRAKGYEAEFSSEYLTSSAEPSGLLSILSELGEISWAARLDIGQKKVREVMATASLISGEPVLGLLLKAIETGLIERVGDALYFRADPNVVLSKLIGEEGFAGEE